MPGGATDAVMVFADGGSRGNPGPAGYGAVVLAADGVTVLAERADFLGRTTNNVAEYSGLIAGLEAARDLGARRVVVRMDSRLVVEQMSGHWQVKHPDLRVLARTAAALVAGFDEVEFGWVPRARNSAADRLANRAMDAGTASLGAASSGVTRPATVTGTARSGGGMTDAAQPDLFAVAPAATDPAAVLPDPHPSGATRIVVVRHGETTWGAQSRFTGREDVPLTSRGRREADAVAARIRPLAPSAVLSSPLRRCRLTAEAIAAAAGAPVLVDDALVDGLLGEWTGYRAAEIAERWPADFARWRSDPDSAPPGGESFTEIRERVTVLLKGLLGAHRGRTVVLVTHAATTKMILAAALDAPTSIAYRLRVDTASLSGLTMESDGAAVVWAVNDTGHLDG